MYHKIIIIGNLGRDPELRYTPQGTPVANFTVAANRRWTGQDGQRHEETVWFRVSAFGRLADVAYQYLRKGMRVYVEGRLTPDRNTGCPRIFTRRDGSVGTSFEIRAEVLRILQSRTESLREEEEDIPNPFPVDAVADLPGSDEEIPF